MSNTCQLFNVEKSQLDFQNILHYQSEIVNKTSHLAEKLEEFKSVYTNLVKYNSKKIFLFCLDSFYFQYKTLNIEMDNLSRYVSLINNRMYGDYYKLYNIIIMQMSESYSEIRELSVDFKKYTIYKDLEPFQEYNIEETQKLHQDILKAIQILYNVYTNKENKVRDYAINTHVGMSIHSFLHTLEYENTLLREQISLYVNYVHFFHSTHLSFLKKLFCKIDTFQHEIEDDIMSHNKTILSTGTPLPIFDGFSKDLKILDNSCLKNPSEIENPKNNENSPKTSENADPQNPQNPIPPTDPPIEPSANPPAES